MMALVTGVSPVSAPAPAHTAHDQQQQRAPVNYGAAVSHREMVQEKLRVDPASLAHKKRPAADVRGSDDRRDTYEADEERERPGQYVDIDA
jgi:hypothetical protein